MIPDKLDAVGPEDIDIEIVEPEIKVSSENKVPETRVAGITTWKNNCAVSCIAVFLVNAFLSKKLSERAEKNLVSLINEYYGVSLFPEQLKDIFLNTFVLPADRQIILGSVLRNFLPSVGMKSEEENMLSNEAFVHLAEEFDFNVVFYSNVEKSIQKSNVIPSINVNGATITVYPYFNVHAREGHFDLIMEDQKEAEIHNKLAFEESVYDLPIEQFVEGQEKALKEKVQKIINGKYDPAQQKLFGGQIEKLFNLARNLQENDTEEATNIVILATNLQRLLNVFFKKSHQEKKEAVDALKKEFLTEIENGKPLLSWTESLKVWSKLFPVTPKQQLKTILEQIETMIKMGSVEKSFEASKIEKGFKP